MRVLRTGLKIATLRPKIIVQGGGGPAWRGNEPASMTQITDRDFTLHDVAGWDTDAGLTIASDATAPKSPSGIIRAAFTPHWVGGDAPGHAGMAHADFAKIYICYAVKFSSNFLGNDSTVNKMVIEWTASPAHPSFVLSASGAGSNPLTPTLRLQDILTFPGGTGNHDPNLVPGAEITRNAWHIIEIYIQGNSAGSATDGVIDWYLDGVHVGSVGGIGWTSAATTFDVFEFYPIWGGTDQTPDNPTTMTMDVDHIYVSGK